ncbi:zinc metalloproteinase nas-14-like [Musca vetustissima]|uniref:zinc metalloproteinase nas-14-like n=1 Tax=Musca vetustissima TaxID=27455 RepID=UPI002AB77F60|nr:zinc metalloproteinase nas-14-like [Musca vetustissima]
MSMEFQDDDEFAGGYIEGDMLPDDSSRNGYPNKKWPFGILKYVFCGNFTEAQKDSVRKCCQLLANKTCVRCVETWPLDYGYVCITNDKQGCYSNVGYLNKWYQDLNLTPTCLENYIVVCHEIIHSLGFTHAHNAYNRDDVYRVNWENIQEGQEHAFEKRNETMDCLVPLKKDSAMSYKRLAFSKNGLETLTPLDGNYTQMGQRTRLTDEDIAKINSMYCYNNCTATTNTTTSTTTTTTTTTEATIIA